MTYQLRIRTLLEYVCPVWGALINAAQTQKLEMVQRQSLAIILGKASRSYRQNMVKLEIDTLVERRLLLTKKFAVRTFVSTRHSSQCFLQNPKYGTDTRCPHPRLILPHMDTDRGNNAPYSFMAKLINNIGDEEFKQLSHGISPPPPSSTHSKTK